MRQHHGLHQHPQVGAPHGPHSHDELCYVGSSVSPNRDDGSGVWFCLLLQHVRLDD